MRMLDIRSHPLQDNLGQALLRRHLRRMLKPVRYAR